MSSERGRKITAVLTAIAIVVGSIAGGAGKPQEAYAAEKNEMTTETAEEPVAEKSTEEKETEKKEEEGTERSTEEEQTEEETEEPTPGKSEEIPPSVEESTGKTEEKSTITETETEEESSITETETEEESTVRETEAETKPEEESTEPETEKVTTAPVYEEPIWSPTMQSGPTGRQPVNVTVPIYSYEIVNVVAPVSYAVAFNPYKLPVKTGENLVSSAQVLSKNYGIINKSSRDMLVEITLMVEDLNGGKITFVGSTEEVLQADKDTYAIYLAAVPADDSGILVDGSRVDKDTVPAALSDVSMRKAEGSAVPLYEGSNRITFRLSKAIYELQDGVDFTLGNTQESEMEELFRIRALADDGTGAAAFTFDGVMNEKADWTKLKEGIRISVVYTYEPAWDERILPGTGGMVDSGE